MSVALNEEKIVSPGLNVVSNPLHDGMEMNVQPTEIVARATNALVVLLLISQRLSVWDIQQYS